MMQLLSILSRFLNMEVQTMQSYMIID